MRLKIMQIGEPVLRQPSIELTHEEIKSSFIQELIQHMKETLYDAPGVGLAAPQIGLPIQLAVLEDREEYIQMLTPAQCIERERTAFPFQVIINPKLTIVEAESREFFEGCLSMAGYIGLTPRALVVQVDCLNEKAIPVTIKARGWYARTLQHEIDHLHGVLCIDRANLRTLMTIENYNKFWKNKTIPQVCDELNGKL
jgi:peptide deformylase